MNKNKRKKENANQKNMILENAFDKKVKDFVGEMIENLKKNKEAYIVICTALGLVINAIWNIACGIGYRGYADGLNISTQFIQKDNQVVSFIAELFNHCICNVVCKGLGDVCSVFPVNLLDHFIVRVFAAEQIAVNRNDITDFRGQVLMY